MAINRVILDPGHGGLNSNGEYTTSPHKMHTFPDGKVAFEGVLNREFAKAIYEELRCEGFATIFTVDPQDEDDVSLAQRAAFANKYPRKETLLISLHCNASPGHNASGGEVWTSPGSTMSDSFADYLYLGMNKVYKTFGIEMRPEMSDGDYDREANFYMLTRTHCPAVLIEFGFFDYLPDFNLLTNPQFIQKVSKAVAESIIKFIKNETN